VKDKVVLLWSGGKDSAMALHALLKSGLYEIVSLLTTVSKQYERISHHGVRVELLEQQASTLARWFCVMSGTSQT
jgi:diphthamide synthase (EF-2-diphthine--ammonia ligase)